MENNPIDPAKLAAENMNPSDLVAQPEDMEKDPDVGTAEKMGM